MIISQRIGEIMPRQELLQHLLAYAKIDYIMNPEDNYMVRIYHYDKSWVPEGHFLKIDDSGGDHYHVLFSPAGCIIKGFDHESDLSPYNYDEDEPMPEVIANQDFYDGAPAALLELLFDPALEKEVVTFCAWQTEEDTAWHSAKSDIPEGWDDGIDTFLYYAADLTRYKEWFEEYYEADLDMKVLQTIFAGQNPTAEMIGALNPEGDAEEILSELRSQF